MSYLENKYCTFKPLFKFDPIEKNVNKKLL